MKKASFFITCCTAGLLTMPTAYAQQRHHEAHVHGHGQLNIAVDSKMLHMELKVPAHDVLEFETITNEKQHQEVEQTLRKIESSGLWTLPVAASCQLVRAQASAGHDDESEHDTHHHGGDHAHTDHNDAHDSHHDNDGHMDISATYTYQCQNPDAINSIATRFFDEFERSQTISIQSFTNKGQQSGKLSRNKPEAAI